MRSPQCQRREGVGDVRDVDGVRDVGDVSGVDGVSLPTSPDKTSHDKTSADKTLADQTSHDKTLADSASADKTSPDSASGPVALRPARMRVGWLLAGVGAALVAAAAGLALGPVRLPLDGIALALLDRIPGVHVDSGLTPLQDAILIQIRLPRVCLGLLVGAMLALAGGSYQGIFRNPLADPYLLGVAAGAGLGATIAIAGQRALGSAADHVTLAVPVAAFTGALLAVAFTYLLGASGGRHRTPATLILAGVAVSSFFTAGQSFLQQRYVDTIRDVYSWIMGRLNGASWHDVRLLLPYVVVTSVVLLAYRRHLDVMAVGDEEASTLGAHPGRTRIIVIVAASLGTAAAVSVSGLIGFVGIVVPHAVRLLAGHSYRIILPLSMLFGGAFLALTDLAARTLTAPNEIPIGVVTAFFGAPFFIIVLRTTRRI